MRRTIFILTILLTAQTLGAAINIIRLDRSDLTLKFGALSIRLAPKSTKLPDPHLIAVRIIGSTRARMMERASAIQNGCRYYDAVVIRPTVIQKGPDDVTLNFGSPVDARWVEDRNGAPRAAAFVLALQVVDDWGDLLPGRGRRVPLMLHDRTREEAKAYNEFVQACTDLTVKPDVVTREAIQEAHARAAEHERPGHEASFIISDSRTSPAAPSAPPAPRGGGATRYVPEWAKAECMTIGILPAINLSMISDPPGAELIAER
ncbi:MAG TPA: hypothetical protein VI670_15935 [Thermoanaerobaculia bacterium]|jgi:hypothetical protein